MNHESPFFAPHKHPYFPVSGADLMRICKRKNSRHVLSCYKDMLQYSEYWYPALTKLKLEITKVRECCELVLVIKFIKALINMVKSNVCRQGLHVGVL